MSNGNPFDFGNFLGGMMGNSLDEIANKRTQEFLDTLTKKATVKDIADKYPDVKKRVETTCPWCGKKLAFNVSCTGYGEDGTKVVETKCPSCQSKLRLKVRK